MEDANVGEDDRDCLWKIRWVVNGVTESGVGMDLDLMCVVDFLGNAVMAGMVKMSGIIISAARTVVN